MKKNLFLVMMFLLISWAMPVEASQITHTGTGIYPGYKDGYVIVKILYGGSPAEKAGIRIGDRILQINDKTDFYNKPLTSIAGLLNPNPDNTVKIGILRGTKIQDFTLKSASMPLTSSSLPRSDTTRGKLEPPQGGSSKYTTSFTPRDGVQTRDEFYVVSGSKVLGTATLSVFHDEKFHIRLSCGDASPSDLAGASLYLFRPWMDPAQMRTIKNPEEEVKKLTGGDKPPVDDRLYHEYIKRKDMKRDMGEVLSHDRKAKRITLKVRDSVTSRPLSGPTRQNLVTTRYIFVDVYYQNNTPTIPGNAVARIDRGNYLGYFYKERDGKIQATLLHILDKD